jgi:hypothetical protein
MPVIDAFKSEFFFFLLPFFPFFPLDYTTNEPLFLPNPIPILTINSYTFFISSLLPYPSLFVSLSAPKTRQQISFDTVNTHNRRRLLLLLLLLRRPLRRQIHRLG